MPVYYDEHLQYKFVWLVAKKTNDDILLVKCQNFPYRSPALCLDSSGRIPVHWKNLGYFACHLKHQGRCCWGHSEAQQASGASGKTHSTNGCGVLFKNCPTLLKNVAAGIFQQLATQMRSNFDLKQIDQLFCKGAKETTMITSTANSRMESCDWGGLTVSLDSLGLAHPIQPAITPQSSRYLCLLHASQLLASLTADWKDGKDVSLCLAQFPVQFLPPWGDHAVQLSFDMNKFHFSVACSDIIDAFGDQSKDFHREFDCFRRTIECCDSCYFCQTLTTWSRFPVRIGKISYILENFMTIPVA